MVIDLFPRLFKSSSVYVSVLFHFFFKQLWKKVTQTGISLNHLESRICLFRRRGLVSSYREHLYQSVYLNLLNTDLTILVAFYIVVVPNMIL